MITIKQTILLQMKNSLVRPMFLFCLIVNPIMNTVFLYEMFLNSEQVNFLAYIISSSGLMALWVTKLLQLI